AQLNGIARQRKGNGEQRLGGAVAANRARAALSGMFRWAIGERLCAVNPVVGTNRKDEPPPRERSLSDQEAATTWLASGDDDYGRILRLLLLTPCRRDEIGNLQWSEVDFKNRTLLIARSRTKNRTDHLVPLPEAALAILKDIPRRDREYVFGMGTQGFSGWSKSKTRLDQKLDFSESWRLHDL